MKIFVTIDDAYGMMFNKRRQSKDKNLVDYIVKKCQENKLWMNLYSSKQFELSNANVLVDEKFLVKAEKDDFCFVENLELSSYENQIEVVYLCKWNRRYPSDLKFDLNLEKCFELSNVEEFVGNSHEKITIEEWIRS